MAQKQETICLLCKKRVADKTGSHIIPNFLIQSSFANGRMNGRGQELIFPVNIFADFRFGREIQPEKVENAIGRELTEEEVELNTNEPIPYVRDYIFCKNCEDRLGVIENLYSSKINTINVENQACTIDIAPHLSHLFWLSVIWRISATKFEIKFNPNIEEKIRRILDTCLSLKADSIVSTGYYINLLDTFGYYLIRFKEDGIIHGSYTAPIAEQINPFFPFYINNYIFIFHPKIDKCAKIVPKYLGLEEYLQPTFLNRARRKEICLCLSSELYEQTVRASCDIHAKRFPQQIQTLVSNYWGEVCPMEFATEIFYKYIDGIQRPSEENNGQLLNLFTRDRFLEIYISVFESWAAQGKLSETVTHIHDK